MASVMELLGDAAVAIATPIAAALSPVPPVKQRKRAQMVTGDTPPLIVVTVDEARDPEPATADAAGAWYCYYRLSLVLIQSNAGRVETGMNAVRQFRQDVRRATTFPALTAAGATNIDDCDPVARPTFSRRGLDGNHDYTICQFIVRTKEPR